MGYKETLKNSKVVIALLAIFFIILVVVDVGLQVYAFQNPNDKLAIIIATGANEGIIPILLIFIGAMIAMITGYFSSISTMELERIRTRDNLVIGFYYEIKELHEKFENVPIDDATNCLGYLKRNKIQFSSENSLYFVLKKELFCLDKVILEKLLFLYPKIIHIDELLGFDATVSLPTGSVSADVVNIHTYVNEVKPKLNTLLTLLTTEKKKMEK